MERINPMKLTGKWLDGYAMDYHTLYSIYLGENQWGHKQFDTTHTAIGKLVYELKYRNDQSKVDEIINLISPFLDKWKIKDKVDFIIPVPPSAKRTTQPVYEISVKIGEYLDKQVLSSFLQKDSPVQSKDLSEQKKEISGTITRRKRFKRSVDILIIDDLFETGRTLNEVVQVLKTDINIKNIYVLTMTKTRR